MCPRHSEGGEKGCRAISLERPALDGAGLSGSADLGLRPGCGIPFAGVADPLHGVLDASDRECQRRLRLAVRRRGDDQLGLAIETLQEGYRRGMGNKPAVPFQGPHLGLLDPSEPAADRGGLRCRRFLGLSRPACVRRSGLRALMAAPSICGRANETVRCAQARRQTGCLTAAPAIRP